MIRHHLTTFATAAGMGLLASSACVERKEVITVARDGSVIIELEYEGTEEELSRGDAMPSAGSGWEVVRSIKEERDEVKHVLKSKRRFEPRQELPRSFAAKGDHDADLYLDFPTTVRVERRRDGLYFYFRRVYTPRRWAYMEHWKDLCFDDDVKKLGEKPVEELSIEERGQIVEAFTWNEALKQIEFARIALGQTHPELPVEHRLVARRALLSVYEEETDHIERIIERCERVPEAQRGECFDEQAERVLGEGYAAFVQSLRDGAGFDDAQIARFEEAYRRAERYYEITDALGGHAFEIDVRMPGTIVAHNALDHEVEEDDGMSTVRFQFDGKAFRDRAHELIVVSRLEGAHGVGRRNRIDGGDR